MKKTIRMGDLLHWDTLRERLGGILEWKNLTVERGYGHAPVELDEIMAWLEKYGKPFTPYVCNTTEFLSGAIKEGKSVIFEAQLGSTSASIPIPPPPRRWRPTPQSARASPLRSSTSRSAS